MIVTKNLTKRYGDLTAVKDLSFSASKGEVLGFLGPNAAGKSTTMKMITGFVTPSSGSASVCGFDVGSQAQQAKSRLGYLPEGAPSYGEMTPLQFLNFVADIRGLRGQEKRSRVTDTMARMHLESVLYQPIETLSKGFKRRVGMAQAILHDPQVLIMDEPTDGLDPNQKHEVRELIREMAAQKLIVVSTHILEEVSAVCSRAIIIAKGRVVADDSPAALVAKSRYHNAVSINLDNQDEAIAALKSLPPVQSVERDGHWITAFPKRGRQPFLEIDQLIRDKGWQVSALRVEQGRLEDVFRQVTTGGQRA